MLSLHPFYFFKECQIEKSAHQATLDYVNQPLQTCSTDDDQRGRYEYNQYAEEEGRLNDQWLYLQKNLDAQVTSLVYLSHKYTNN